MLFALPRVGSHSYDGVIAINKQYFNSRQVLSSNSPQEYIKLHFVAHGQNAIIASQMNENLICITMIDYNDE